MIAETYRQVHLAVGATDMRRGIDGLALIVSECFNLDPFSQGLFVFRKRRDGQGQDPALGRHGFLALLQKT